MTFSAVIIFVCFARLCGRDVQRSMEGVMFEGCSLARLCGRYVGRSSVRKLTRRFNADRSARAGCLRSEDEKLRPLHQQRARALDEISRARRLQIDRGACNEN